MKVSERILVFEGLGAELRMILDKEPATISGKRVIESIDLIGVRNTWFTADNILHRLKGLAHACDGHVLKKWLSAYELKDGFSGKSIGVISAGNIPAAGADDFLQVLLAGHKYVGKLSSDDNILLPLIADIIREIAPRFDSQIEFTQGKLEKIDAVIATGSNNSARYFEYYFSKYPHVIRKNRNSVAILDGSEPTDDLKALGEDIFRYFGLGCRNITKVFVPRGYSFNTFFESIFHWGDSLIMNRKYMNNYEYNRNIYLLNSEKLLDNNFLVIKNDIGIASPPGVLFFEEYDSLDDVYQRLRTDRDLVQCVVSKLNIPGAILPGMAQNPDPWDYADGVDTMEFLIKQ